MPFIYTRFKVYILKFTDESNIQICQKSVRACAIGIKQDIWIDAKYILYLYK